MRLGLLVLISLALCAAQTSGNQRDAYFPAPYFGDGENLSSENCGTETAFNQWIVHVHNIRNKKLCPFYTAISPRTILEPTGDCNNFVKRDAIADLRVFPRNCLFRETEEECIRLSVKVLDVMHIDINPSAAFEFTIFITEKMPSVITPICLFNRDNAMDFTLQRESTYIQWSPWKRYPPIPGQIKIKLHEQYARKSDKQDELQKRPKQ